METGQMSLSSDHVQRNWTVWSKPADVLCVVAKNQAALRLAGGKHRWHLDSTKHTTECKIDVTDIHRYKVTQKLQIQPMKLPDEHRTAYTCSLHKCSINKLIHTTTTGDCRRHSVPPVTWIDLIAVKISTTCWELQYLIIYGFNKHYLTFTTSDFNSHELIIILSLIDTPWLSPLPYC